MESARLGVSPKLSIVMTKTGQLRWLYLSLFALILDQASKYWAEHILGWSNKVAILPVFDFSLAHNTGAAFGFLANAGGWQQVFFATLATAVSVVLIILLILLAPHQRHLAVAYALIISGAIGNLIDRLVYQYVIDFIHVFYGSYHFPHFNIADSAIFIGAVLYITEAFNWPFLDSKKQ